jgi:PAS domain S-box-containing protein
MYKMVVYACADGYSAGEIMAQPTHQSRQDATSVSEADHAAKVLIDAVERSAETAFEVRTGGGIFRQMADTVTEILYVSRPDGQIEYLNRRFTEYTGMPLQEGLGFGWSKAVHPDDLTSMTELLKDSVARGEPYETEYRLRAADGSYRWFLARSQPTFGADGAVERWIGTGTDIQALKDAQSKMEHAQERYAAFIRQSSEGIWRYEMEEPMPISLSADEQIEWCFRHGYLAECNDAMAKMYGFASSSEITGARLGDLLVREDPNNIAFLRAFIESGYRIEDAESKEKDKEGATRWFLNNFVGVVQDGYLLRAWGMQRDITRKRTAELKLAESEDRLRFALTASKLVAWNWTAEDGDVSISDNAGGVLGIASSPDLKRMHTHGFIHPDDLPRHRATINAAAQQKDGEYVSQFRFTRPDDQRLIWLEDRGRVTVGENGEILRVTGVIQDITERKKIEEAVRMLNTELEQKVADRTRDMQATLQRIKQMIAHMPIGAMAVDENSRILAVNESCCEMLGIAEAPDEIIGRHAWDFSANYMAMLADPDGYMEIARRIVEERKPDVGREVALKDGRIYVRDYIPIFENGEFHGNLALYRDVTHERRVDATKSEFMSLASHQLRTPLTAVRWTLGKLERSFSDRATEFERHMMEEGRKAASKMTETIDTMLQISRIEAGTVELRQESMELLPCIRGVWEAFEINARAKRQNVRIDCPERLKLQTDAHFLHEILSNLFSNAVKYTPAGGDISIQAAELHGSVRIEVTDTGYGIPGHQQSKIFRKFFRGDNVVSRDTQGTGLGLYLVSLMTSLLHGTISFRSKEGEGTTFTLMLPRGDA